MIIPPPLIHPRILDYTAQNSSESSFEVTVYNDSRVSLHGVNRDEVLNPFGIIYIHVLDMWLHVW